MPLSQGEQIGHFRIHSLIGAGGMGEVYRAADTQLKRDVALKVLLPTFARDAERYARFRREAEMLASLNHPNIATLYGLAPLEAEGNALVMEFVEGETLPCPAPLDTTIARARQIAEALEYAHDRGVIHRDLKPSNIKVTPDGAVKILDFGLAKALDNSPAPASSSDLASSPTLTLGHTIAGQILGTAAYMAPEQVEGKAADRRSDIWSFGAVLFEMLAGKRAFEGSTTVETLASVVKLDPDWAALPKDTPPALVALIRRCLTKDRRKRLQAIAEARIILEQPLEQPAPLEVPTPASLTPGRQGALTPWIVAAGLFALLAALSFVHFRETAPPERTLRYTIASPENSDIHSFAISPDGRLLAISMAINGKRQLWLRSLDALQAQPMAFTEDAAFPFWSPDSRYIGFFAQGKLKRIAASGGPAQSLCAAPQGRGGSWNRDDVIVFAPNGQGASAIQRVAAAGGIPSDVMTTKGIYKHPAFLPDGRHFLYVAVGNSADKNGIYATSLDGKENRRILPDLSAPEFAPAPSGSRIGHLLFIREDTLMAQPFDAGSAQLSGDVFPVAERVSLTTNVNYAPVTVSENGVLLYESGGAATGVQLVWYDRTGKLLGLRGTPFGIYPAISPDEKMVAFARLSGAQSSDIWLRDLRRGTDIRLTSDPSSGTRSPFWSPKGDRIVFQSIRDGHYDLYQKASSGSGQDELLLSTPHPKFVNQWSRGGFIVYEENDPKTRFDLWVLPMQEGQTGSPAKPVPFLKTEFSEGYGQISPDGHWMAHGSDSSGQPEIYVRPFPASEGVWIISTGGGTQPRWRGDGKELFYVAPDGKMMSVAVKVAQNNGSRPVFEPGAPEPLFDSHIVPVTTGEFYYDVTADGKRFVVTTNGASTSSAALPLTVVTNWRAGLEK